MAGAGIVEGFVVACVLSPSNDRSTASTSSSTKSINVEFDNLPWEGAVILPRFEFKNDDDCQIIDKLVPRDVILHRTCPRHGGGKAE